MSQHRRQSRDHEARPVVSIYSRPGCHLCEEMKAVVGRVALAIPLAVEEIDISSDPALENRYGEEIPVLIIDGTKAAKYRITEKELTRVLRGRASGAREPGKSERAGG